MAYKLALIQMTSGADMPANIAALETYVAQAAGQGAQLVATPENTFLMEAPGAERVFYAQENHPGVQAAAKLAGQYKIWLLIGSVAVKVDESGKTLNRSLLFSPDGKIAAHYDKIHLFDVEVGDGQSYRESAKIMAGGKLVLASISPSPLEGEGRGGGYTTEQIASERTPHPNPPPQGGRALALGMTICYDVRFPHLYRALAKAGANMLTVPAAFTQVTGEAHWHVLLRARAIENACFVIAPAQTGTHPGNRKTFGHSLVVDPWGKILVDGGTEPGVVMAEIDLGEVAKVRGRIPSLEHDREFS